MSFLWVREDAYVVRLGGNTYVNCDVLIQFKKTPLFALHRKDGYLAIDFEVYGETGKKIATVKHNNIYINKDVKARYALEGNADRVSLVKKPAFPFMKNRIVDIKRRDAAQGVELDVSVRTYLPNGHLLVLGPDTTNLGGMSISNSVFSNCAVGLQIE